MTISITRASTGHTQRYRGEPEQVRRQLLAAYPWAYNRPGGPARPALEPPLQDLLVRLAGAQDLFVDVED